MSPETGERESLVRQETLILSREEVAGLLGVEACIAAVEEGFRAQSANTGIAPGLLSAAAPGGAFHVKTAGLRLQRFYFAAKLNGNFYANQERFGLPRIQGLILLCDAENGYPLAVMDSTEITVRRTAAATAVAARHLARADAAVATICGCGVQGRAQLRFLTRVLPIQQVFAFDLNPDTAGGFARDLSLELELEVSVAEDLAPAARKSDVVVTCTPAKEALLGPGDVSPGTFVAGVGADSGEKQELHADLLAASVVVVDHLEQCAAIGDLHHAIRLGKMSREDVQAELSEVVAGGRLGRRTSADTVVFDSTGVAHQDAAAASLVFEKAVQTQSGLWRRLI